MHNEPLCTVYHVIKLTFGSKASGDVAKTLDGCRTTKDLAYGCEQRHRGDENEWMEK